MLARVFIPLVVVAGVLAQVPGLPQCVIDCSTQAAGQTDCGVFTNATCVCTSSEFQAAAGACLAANCTPADTQAGMDTQNAICGALASGSGSPTTPAPTSGAPTGTNSASSTVSTPPGTPEIPPCVLSCSTAAAAQTECGVFTNATCVCSSSDFQAAAGACLAANCTAADTQAGLTLQQSICSALGSPTTTASTTSTPTGTGAAGAITASFSAAGFGAILALLFAL